MNEPICIIKHYVTIHNEQGPATYGPFLTEAAGKDKVVEVLGTEGVVFDDEVDRIYFHALMGNGTIETTEMNEFETAEIFMALAVSDTENKEVDAKRGFGLDLESMGEH